MKPRYWRWFHIQLEDWTWWAWVISAVLLGVGLWGYDRAFSAAMVVTAGQGFILLVRDRSLRAISFQLRVAYGLLLLISYPPPMRWLYWLPMAGTLAFIVFGYCLLGRCLSLLPWNSHENYTLGRLWRTFFHPRAGCAREWRTLDAQVAPAVPGSRHHSHETVSAIKQNHA